jgi:hypothetical protein
MANECTRAECFSCDFGSETDPPATDHNLGSPILARSLREGGRQTAGVLNCYPRCSKAASKLNENSPEALVILSPISLKPTVELDLQNGCQVAN